MDSCRIVAALGLGLVMATSALMAAEASEEGERAWLGVWLADAVDGGVQVLTVVDEGPAARAGLRAGDIVIEVGATEVGSEEELGRILRSKSPGETLDLRVLRDGRRLDVKVTLGERQPRSMAWTMVPRPPRPARGRPPQPAPESYAFVYSGLWNPESVGLQVTEISPALRAHYGAPEEAGVLVTRVEAGQPAAVAGLEVGDILVGIGGRPIRSEREVRGNLVRWTLDEPVEVRVIRAGEVVDLAFTPVGGGRERVTRTADPRDEAARQELLRQRLESQIERLERRLAELKKELERIDADE